MPKRYDPVKSRMVQTRQRISRMDDRSGSRMSRQKGYKSKTTFKYKAPVVRASSYKYKAPTKAELRAKEQARAIKKARKAEARARRRRLFTKAVVLISKSIPELEAREISEDEKNNSASEPAVEIVVEQIAEPMIEDKDVTDINTTIFKNYPERNTHLCPNCSFDFVESPKRGGICKKCGQKYAVRSTNRLYNSNLLTNQQVAANDCFWRICGLIETPIRIAYALLTINPNLTEEELFVKMIEYYDNLPRNSYNNAEEVESHMYRAVADYVKVCGGDGVKYIKLAAQKEKIAKEKIQQLENKIKESNTRL